jgi:alpha-amylase
MLADGVPMIYQGQEQSFSGAGVPSNREAMWTSGFSTTSELYKFIKLMNVIRRHAINVNPDYLSYQSHVIYSDNSTIAYRKGVEGRQIISVLASGGEQTGEYQLDFATAYASGVMVTDVISCTNYTVNQYGQLTLPMGGGVPHVLFPANKMNGSELCGFGNVSLEVLRGGAVGSRSGSVTASMIAALVTAVMAFALV